MTATQAGALNAEILRNLGIVAESETKLNRVAKYLRKLVRENDDQAQMTKEEFLAKLDRGEKEFREGKTHRIESVEDLSRFISSL